MANKVFNFIQQISAGESMKPSSIVLATISVILFIAQIVLVTSAIWAIGYPNDLSENLSVAAVFLIFIQGLIWGTIADNECI